MGRYLIVAAAVWASSAFGQTLPYNFNTTTDGKIDPTALQEDFEYLANQVHQQKVATSNLTVVGVVTSVAGVSPICSSGGANPSISLCGNVPGTQVSGDISGNAANVTGVVAVANGGTAGITAAAARTNLGAAASGSNADISTFTGTGGGVYFTTSAFFSGAPFYSAGYYGLSPRNTAAQNDAALVVMSSAVPAGASIYWSTGTFNITSFSWPKRWTWIGQSVMGAMGDGFATEILASGTTGINFNATTPGSRFSELRDIGITVSAGATALRINNQGVTLNNVDITGGAVGIEIDDMFDETWNLVTVNGTSTAVYVNSGVSGSINANHFINMTMNCNNGTGVGFGINPGVSAGTLQGNVFITAEVEQCNRGFILDAGALGNTFINPWVEALSGSSPICYQDTSASGTLWIQTHADGSCSSNINAGSANFNYKSLSVGPLVASNNVGVEVASNVFTVDGTGSLIVASSITTIGQATFATSGGNVGIGVLSPVSLLEIDGPLVSLPGTISTTGDLNIKSTSARSQYDGPSIAFRGKYDPTAYAPYGAIQGYRDTPNSGETGAGLAFWTTDNTTGILQRSMVINNLKYVGVSTGIPLTPLDVGGAATIRGQETVTSSMTVQTNLLVTSSVTAGALFGNGGNLTALSASNLTGAVPQSSVNLSTVTTWLQTLMSSGPVPTNFIDLSTVTTRFTNVATDTTTLGTRLTAVAASTTTFGNWQSTASVSLTSLAATTTTLNTNINNTSASTQTLAVAVAASTTTLFNVRASSGVNGDITTLTALKTVSSSGATFTSSLTITGVTDGSSATAGKVGELITFTGGTTSLPPSGSYVAVATVTLTAGDWDVGGTGVFATGASSAITDVRIAISNSNSTADSSTSGGFYLNDQNAIPVSGLFYNPLGNRPFSVSGTTAIYIVCRLTYSVAGGATCNGASELHARRVR